jgi:hypothetical protein
MNEMKHYLNTRLKICNKIEIVDDLINMFLPVYTDVFYDNNRFGLRKVCLRYHKIITIII